MKKILFILCIIVLMLIILGKFYLFTNTIYSCKIIDVNQEQEIIKDRVKINNNHIKLYYNDNLLPYDYIKDYYLLASNNEKYTGKIKSDGYKIAIIKPSLGKYEIMNSNSSIKILIYNDKNYYQGNLKLTNLSVMSINDNTKMTFFDVATNEHQGHLIIKNYFIDYHVRGNYSLTFPKKSYKLNITDVNGNNKKVRLLGMREDDDWILNPMYFDNSFMREKIGYDIWNRISTSSQYTLNYIELFIDNEYKGIYYLMEPVDMKFVQGSKKNDLLISIKDWAFDFDRQKIYSKKSTKNTTINEFELDDGNQKEFINVLKAMLYKVENKKYKVDINYDIDNLTNYELFINMILAIDNTYKNTKLYFEYDNGNYNLEIYPWDLDISMMNEKNVQHFDINEYLIVEIIPESYRNNITYQQILRQKYKKFRKDFYNMDTINIMIDNYTNYLTAASASARNELKWGYPNIYESAKNLKSFFEERIKILDEYYGV